MRKVFQSIRFEFDIAALDKDIVALDKWCKNIKLTLNLITVITFNPNTYLFTRLIIKDLSIWIERDDKITFNDYINNISLQEELIVV